MPIDEQAKQEKGYVVFYDGQEHCIATPLDRNTECHFLGIVAIGNHGRDFQFVHS
jgi:hypothetical protein